MTRAPKVSVVIPTYNRAHLLPRAVNSVLAQTYSDFELIIVDDGSGDETQAVISAFSDRRIRSFRHERNRGVSAARNTGICEARGEYLSWFDDDDEWLENNLECFVPVLENNPDVGAVYSWVDLIDDATGERFPMGHSNLRGDVYHEVFRRMGLTGAWLYRTEAARSVGGFDEDLPNGQDFVWQFQFLRKQRIELVPRVGMIFHEHDGPRLSRRRDPVFWRDYDRFVSVLQTTNRDALERFPRRNAAFFRWRVIACVRAGDRRKALALLFQSFKVAPLDTVRAVFTNSRMLRSISGRLFSLLRGRI